MSANTAGLPARYFMAPECPGLIGCFPRAPGPFLLSLLPGPPALASSLGSPLTLLSWAGPGSSSCLTRCTQEDHMHSLPAPTAP